MASYENVLATSGVRVSLLAFGTFDGSVSFGYYVDNDIKTWKEISFEQVTGKMYWIPKLFKDPESKNDLLLVTQPTGNTAVFNLLIEANDGNVNISLEPKGHLNGGNESFPMSCAVSETETPKAAVGYVDGDVILYDLKDLSPLFTFHTTDLQTGSNDSNSIPRALVFSPGGLLLAVARDIQSSGSITLYDMKYGENVGQLTTPTHSSKAAVGGFAHSGWIMGLSFNEDGSLLASGGFDSCVRFWNIDTREREATIQISVTDLDNTLKIGEMDQSIVSGVQFINKGVRFGAGGDSNQGVCIISFDRGVRWYREAGGI
ncbi:uncharacterized protein KQ657_004786 [Scheffersomyces spartinae]|uniref:Antiviral protein SKI8 n=1 Tax=Scheffersomyces spartinae TaxID=45513 RepID=A0A9P7V9Y6_9ASCO|nr:uncharacterized protein KQ657_004786 [Scheffersomyces spartinae]KAG7194078.1 hypothetical protein KQ657_004786 [Scheffersomyces spartinae]